MHKKIAFYAVQGTCSGALAGNFCDARGLNHSTRFGSKGIDFAAAAVLARGWPHRMQYIMNEWLSAPPAKDAAFAQDVVGSYVEPSEFVHLAALAHIAAARAAIAEVRNFVG